MRRELGLFVYEAKGRIPLELLHDFETELFDDRVGENFLGDTFYFRLCFFAAPTIQIQDEEFALTNVGNLRVTQTGKSMLNGLPLRVKYRALRHYPDVCFHGTQYSNSPAAVRCYTGVANA